MKPITKPAKFNPPANLPDYQKTYASFDWNQAKKDLSYLSGQKLNAGHIALANQINQGRGEETALILENDQGEVSQFTYQKLNSLSNQFANYLQTLNLQKGDRVFFFLPRCPEVYFGFLGALKAGAVGGTFFAAFGQEALRERLQNSGARFLITTQELQKRVLPLQKDLPDLEKILLIDTPEFENNLYKQSEKFASLPMEPHDPAIMLYTSATGNTPVCGIVLPHQGIISQAQTATWVLDLKPGDLYWCTADPGWITGISYGILGNLASGATTISFSGRFNTAKWLEILEKYQVNVWYTAPTALRLLRKEIEKPIRLPHLRHICSVGEALEPSLIAWAQQIFGLPIHDTYWQTETGSMMLVNFRTETIKPGSMGQPVPGIKPAIIDRQGQELGPDQEGELAFQKGWPAQMIDVWKNPARFQSYFRGNWFVTGDRAKKDGDGYFYFVGRENDVIKTSGERVGPFEVESALTDHPAIVEAGVIGKPDPTRGEIIKAFVVLIPGQKGDDALRENIKSFVKTHLAGHAYPREIDFVTSLPKNRSGKIVRRILKARELGLPEGDTSTLIKDDE